MSERRPVIKTPRESDPKENNNNVVMRRSKSLDPLDPPKRVGQALKYPPPGRLPGTVFEQPKKDKNAHKDGLERKKLSWKYSRMVWQVIVDGLPYCVRFMPSLTATSDCTLMMKTMAHLTQTGVLNKSMLVLDVQVTQQGVFCIGDMIISPYDPWKLETWRSFMPPKVAKQLCNFEVRRRALVGMLLAVADFHGHGISHGDLKPENFAVEKDVRGLPYFKLIDLDNLVMDGGYLERGAHARCRGTDYYNAPEAYAGFQSLSSDMWAYGIIIWVIMTGSWPYSSDVFIPITHCGHPRVKDQRHMICQAIQKCLSRDNKLEENAANLMARCCKSDPAERITAEQALQHPFIKPYWRVENGRTETNWTTGDMGQPQE